MNVCACGCGAEVNRKYAQGHAARAYWADKPRKPRKERGLRKEYTEDERLAALHLVRERGVKEASLRLGIPVPPDADQYVPRSGPEGGVCAICGRPPKTRKLHVDHDHKTGRVRGLLCYTCNRFILGRYATPAKLRAAADYLERNAG